MKNNVYIIDAKRTAIARFGGSFVGTSATDLAAVAVKYILNNNLEILNKIDEVILGNTLSAGLGQNPARIVAYKSGLSQKIPSYVVNKVCGSGMKSVVLGAQSIELNEANLVIAGGMENMSRAPFLINNYRFGVKSGNQEIIDCMINDGLFCSLIGKHMGITAEIIAKKYKISRKIQDLYSLNSHKKAVKAIKENIFDDEIVPVEVKIKNNIIKIKQDEQPREDTSIDALAKLKPVFKENGTVTAGNSSSINDGAAVTLLVSENIVKKLKLKPLAVIKSYASVAIDPRVMGMGSYYAAIKCLDKVKMNVKDIDLWEINEAFASQSIAVIKLLGINENKVNVNGGAIALGHPIGASGARILVTLVHELKRRKLKYGVASLCIGGGQGIAMLIENYE
jgi:acetyl-CoA C-acetyltransferase